MASGDLVEGAVGDGDRLHRGAVGLDPRGQGGRTAGPGRPAAAAAEAAAARDQDVLEFAAATILASWLTVGAGSLPLKPPIVTTARPVWMMIGAVVCEPVAASRYLARTLVGLEVGDHPARELPAPPAGPRPATAGARRRRARTELRGCARGGRPQRGRRSETGWRGASRAPDPPPLRPPPIRSRLPRPGPGRRSRCCR